MHRRLKWRSFDGAQVVWVWLMSLPTSSYFRIRIRSCKRKAFSIRNDNGNSVKRCVPLHASTLENANMHKLIFSLLTVLAVMAGFSLALMAKPAASTLPLVLLQTYPEQMSIV